VWLAAWLLWFGPPERVRWLSDAERTSIVAQRGMRDGERDQRRRRGTRRAAADTHDVGLALIGGSDAYCSYLFLSWLPSYLQTARHLSLGTTSLYTAVPTRRRSSSRSAWRRSATASEGQRRGHRAAAVFIAGSSLTAAALIASVPFVDSVPVLLGMIAVAIGCIATNTSQVFALTTTAAGPQGYRQGNGLRSSSGQRDRLPVADRHRLRHRLTTSFDAAFVIAGAMMLLGAGSALFIANRPMQTRTAEEPAVSLVP